MNHINTEPSTPTKSKSFGLSVFTFTFAGAILFLLFMSFFYPGVDLPQGMEGERETSSKEDSSKKPSFELSAVQEPWVFTQEMAKEGERVYRTNCAFCHGNTGLGDGVAGKGLQPLPRNLVEGKWKFGGSSISLYKIITNGVPNTSMASYSSLTPAERWSLVHFIRSITQNKVEDNKEKLSLFGKEAD